MGRKRHYYKHPGATRGGEPVEEIDLQVRENMDIAHEIEKARKAAGLSQSQLAARMGAKQLYIAHLESGHSSVEMRSILSVGRALGLRVELRFEPSDGSEAHEKTRAFARSEVGMARRIEKARKAAGLTQAQLAERMRTTPSTVARLESGHDPAFMSSFRNVARALGTRVAISFEPRDVAALSGNKREEP